MNDVVTKSKEKDKQLTAGWRRLLTLHHSVLLFFVVLTLEWRGSTEHLVLVVSGLLCALFVHEAGHWYASKRVLFLPLNGTLYAYGIAWESERRFIALTPHLSWREVAFSLAGPFVNLVGAGCATIASEILSDSFPGSASVIASFGSYQVLVGCFHLLPILPLDGGVIYRAIVERRNAVSSSLATPLPSEPSSAPDNLVDVRIRLLNASQIASLVVTVLFLLSGQFACAVCTGALLYSIIRLHLEESSLRALEGKIVESHMRPFDRLDVIPHGASLEKALRIGATSFQDSFPVVHAQKLLGFITKEKLFGARSHLEPNAPVSQLINRTFRTVAPTDLLQSIFSEQSLQQSTPLAVVQDESFLGVLLPRQVLETLLTDQVAREVTALSRPRDEDDEFLL
jgi:Zn-dependent protease